MAVKTRKSIEEYLAAQYPFNVVAEAEGGYTILYPDLPGCMTQVETLEEIPQAATEIRELWIESELEMGREIPPPSYSPEYSGKFIVRISRSLHRTLAQSSEREGVSLNQYAITLLARGDAQADLARQLGQVTSQLTAIQKRLRYQVTGIPGETRTRGQIRQFPGGRVVAA